MCSVYLTDPDLRHLTLQATIGLARESVGRVRLEFGEGLVGFAGAQREPIAIQKAQEHPRFRFFPESGEAQYASLAAAPLMVRDVPIGVLVVQTQQERQFEQHDVELLQTCAQLIAPVVMNARLLDLVKLPDSERERVAAELASSGIPVAGQPALATPAAEPERSLRGIPTSPGVAIGPVYLLEDPLDFRHVEYTPSEDLEDERQDLRDALGEARRELESVREEMGSRFGEDLTGVFNTQIQILEDKGFLSRLEEAVRKTGNALEALRSVLESYRAIFSGIEDPYFRERGLDIDDVGRRVLGKLLGVRHHNVPLSEGAIVVASQMLPAHFALLETDRMGGILSEHGGPTSHGAIFARSLEIPAVTGVPGLLAAASPGEMVIVDGATGQVHLSPDEGLLEEYQRAQQRHVTAVEHLDALRALPAETHDGRRIALTANVGLLNDLVLVERHGAEGVGLFRTELLALAQRSFPDEEEQHKLYSRVASAMAPRTVTIRTLDVGGDKRLPALGDPDEENPQLGWRSLRLALSHPAKFETQLRSILRASAMGTVRILFPMVSGIGELREAKVVLERAQQTLGREGIPFDPAVPVGVMIEVPSAALVADVLAEEADFFSIGTNDLTQYTLAVDRGNERVAHLYDPLHPAVLMLIDRTVRAAERASIPVSVCGEMAGDPLAVPLLVGLGIGELSATPSSVPMIKEIIRALDAGPVAEDARRALRARSPSEVHRIAIERLHEAGLFDHPDVGPWLGSVTQSLVDRGR